ncbi:MAG: hypothetical protein U1A77_22710 [Pirellulales bacterium]
MRRPSQNQAEAPGQDSFLDVVANLVGILIILIIVVGAATQKAFVEEITAAAQRADSASSAGDASADATSPPQDSEPTVDQQEVEAAAAAARAVEEDIFKTDSILRQQQFEVSYRRLERDKALTLVSAAEKALAEKREQLDKPEQEEFDRRAELEAARKELEELERINGLLSKQKPPPGVLEHLPTPMAKTVFGKEIHLRLGNGRLSIVPWDQLVEQLKADAPQKIWRLRETASFSESVGPLDGYTMKYTIKRTEVSTTGRPGGPTQQRAELDRFVLAPVDELVGETIEESFREESDFLSLVKRNDPNRVTITIWVYPDSFQHYRTYKKFLFDRGFLTAARPLPEGHPIGGSPDGSRSAAE